MVFHSFASTRKCNSQFFPSFKKEEKWIFSEAHSLHLKHLSLLSEHFLVLLIGSKCHFLLCDISPLVNWSMNLYHNQHKACSLSSFTITFATSQQYQTYLSTASVWFSHSSELLSLPRSAAQLALLLEWPTPLLGVEEEKKGTKNSRKITTIIAKHLLLYR